MSTSVSRTSVILSAAIVSAIFLGSCSFQKEESISGYLGYRDIEFTRLEEIREKKINKILYWLNHQKELITDKQVQKKLSAFYTRIRTAVQSVANKTAFLQANEEIEQFYVETLGSFYDMLFINKKGNVFYSVKMENDFQTSLINGPYADTNLAAVIRSKPEKITFVDFEYYEASDEAAAFYILPIRHDRKHTGWIALQLSINQLNKLLTERSGLGLTGEAYLVNGQQLMLTDSRFITDSTVLSKRIDTTAVRSQSDSAGSEVIQDYRGIEVLSTYRAFLVGNTNWRIVVEKDENEVITDYYRKYENIVYPSLVAAIEKQTGESLHRNTVPACQPGRKKRVDMGELLRVEIGKSLFTPGIATCTGVVAYPTDYKFAYMAHLSPLDACYNLSRVETAIMGDRTTDLLALMLRRILFFEITPSQVGQMRFVIAAPHSRGLKTAISKLVSAGIFLSQIKACILPGTTSVSLSYQPYENGIIALWKTSTGAPPAGLLPGKIHSIDHLTKKL